MSTMLDIEVTRRCNLRCDYCFVGWSRDWTTDMPREAALSIIEEGRGEFSRLHDGCRSCEHKESCGHCRAYVTASGRPFFGNDGVCNDVLAGLKRVPAEGSAQRRVHLPVAL
jgi:MoaA/NifB/PqqE/SkfB family radical SAM enzyme